MKKITDLKIYMLISYIWFFFIIGLFCPEKNNKKLKFHVGQGMIFTVFSFLLGIVTSIITDIMNPFIPFIKTIFNIILLIINLGLIIYGMVNVIHDSEEKLPIIGKYAFYK